MLIHMPIFVTFLFLRWMRVKHFRPCKVSPLSQERKKLVKFTPLSIIRVPLCYKQVWEESCESFCLAPIQVRYEVPTQFGQSGQSKVYKNRQAAKIALASGICPCLVTRSCVTKWLASTPDPPTPTSSYLTEVVSDHWSLCHWQPPNGRAADQLTTTSCTKHHQSNGMARPGLLVWILNT